MQQDHIHSIHSPFTHPFACKTHSHSTDHSLIPQAHAIIPLHDYKTYKTRRSRETKPGALWFHATTRLKMSPSPPPVPPPPDLPPLSFVIHVACSYFTEWASYQFVEVHSKLKTVQLMKWCSMSSDVCWHIRDKLWPNAEAWFNIALRPRKPEGSLGRTAQDGHLDFHTAPELWTMLAQQNLLTDMDMTNLGGRLNSYRILSGTRTCLIPLTRL